VDAGEGQEIVWTYRWEVLPAPRPVASWLVDDGGGIEPAQPMFFAFQVREASVRAFATIPKFASGTRRGGQLRFGEPPAHFMEVAGGDNNLRSQEIFAFLPAAVATDEQMPWFRVGRHLFFQEEEARRVAHQRREAAGTAVAVARAGVGPGSGGSGGPGFDFEPPEE